MMAPYDAGCAVRSSVRSSFSVLSSRPRSVVESSEDIRRREAETLDARRVTANTPTPTAHRTAASLTPVGTAAGSERWSKGDASKDEGASLARVGARDSLAEAPRLGACLRHLSNHPLTGTAEIQRRL